MAYLKKAGTIDKLSRNLKNIHFEGDDSETWFSAYKKEQLSGAGIGDAVNLEYLEKDVGGKVFNNIQGDVKITSQGEKAAGAASSGAAPAGRKSDFVPKQFPLPATHPDRSIIRQNAATRAMEVLTLFPTEERSPEEIVAEAIDLARVFEAYYAGEV